MENFAALLATYFLDILSGGSLDYSEPHHGDTSRIDAGIRIANTGGVRSAKTPGTFWVRSEDNHRKEYLVYAVKGDVSCECTDHLHRAPHVCKHIVAATYTHAHGMAFADAELEVAA